MKQFTAWRKNVAIHQVCAIMPVVKEMENVTHLILKDLSLTLPAFVQNVKQLADADPKMLTSSG